MDEDAEIVAPADELSDLNHVANASDARHPRSSSMVWATGSRKRASINAMKADLS